MNFKRTNRAGITYTYTTACCNIYIYARNNHRTKIKSSIFLRTFQGRNIYSIDKKDKNRLIYYWDAKNNDPGATKTENESLNELDLNSYIFHTLTSYSFAFVTHDPIA